MVQGGAMASLSKREYKGGVFKFFHPETRFPKSAFTGSMRTISQHDTKRVFTHRSVSMWMDRQLAGWLSLHQLWCHPQKHPVSFVLLCFGKMTSSFCYLLTSSVNGVLFLLSLLNCPKDWSDRNSFWQLILQTVCSRSQLQLEVEWKDSPTEAAVVKYRGNGAHFLASLCWKTFTADQPQRDAGLTVGLLVMESYRSCHKFWCSEVR